MYWLEMHIHTALGSIDSIYEFDELIEEYKRLGVDGICVAEHIPFRTLSDSEYGHLYATYNLNKNIETQLDIYPGAEIKLPNGCEYLVYGIQIPKYIFDLSWSEAIDNIHSLGGIIIKSHPFRDGEEFDVIDGIELYNNGSSNEQNLRTLEYYKNNKQIITTIGSDAHYATASGLAIIELENRPKDQKEMIAMLRDKSLYKYVIKGEHVSFV